MSSKLLKRFLLGAAFVSSLLPSMALAGTACVYVIGRVQGQTVTTPAVPITVPASELLTQPVRVHLDNTAQNIIGYSLNLPGLDLGTKGSPLFSIPELNEQIPSFTVNLPDLDYTPYRCVDVSGVEVPAVPYHIPASALVLPGAFADVGGLVFNLGGLEWAVPGKLLRFDGKQILFPAHTGSTPSGPVGTPDLTVTFVLYGSVNVLRYLTPQG